MRKALAVRLDVRQVGEASLPGNHLACASMNERGMSQGPRCEPATNSSVEARLTGSTGIQKLTFCAPSML